MSQRKNIRGLFADRIVELRDERDWTQEDLAHRAGISTRSISNIENCVFSATIDTVHKLATGLRVEPRDLFDFRPPN